MISQVKVIGLPDPRTWDDFEAGCLATYRGGHQDEKTLEAFRHGMRTVFNLLRYEFKPASECRKDGN